MALSFGDDFLVAIQPDNDMIDYSSLNDDPYGIYILKPECRNMVSLLKGITVIRPRNNNGKGEEIFIEDGLEI
jgi:hypothetical protein